MKPPFIFKGIFIILAGRKGLATAMTAKVASPKTTLWQMAPSSAGAGSTPFAPHSAKYNNKH